MIDIDALKSKFTGISEEYSFKNFLASANIKEGAYGFISRVLQKNQETILLNLTDDEMKALESRVGGTKGLGKKLTVSKLAGWYAPEVWNEIVKICKDSWSENNKRMMSNFNSIKSMLEKGSQLCFNASDHEIATTISEFIDAINSHENEEERNQQLLYVDSLLSIILSNGNIGRDFDSKFNHDRIPRIIARYFFDYTTAEFWNNRGYKSRDDVGTSLKQENTNYANIINYIHIMLNGADGSDSLWSSMGEFLDVQRILRNYVDHYQPYITNDNERLTAAQFILYTFVGTYYAIKQNLFSCNVDNKVLKDKNPWTITKTKTLCVYFNDQLNKELTESDKTIVESVLPQIKLFKKVKEFIPQHGKKKVGCIEFKLEEGEDYCIKFGDHNPVDIPKELIWESPGGRPVVIWNNVTPYFFRDLSTVNAELRPYIEAAHEAALENNTKATKELTGTIEVLSSRMAMFEQDIKQGLIDNAGMIAETMKAMTEAILLLRQTLIDISTPPISTPKENKEQRFSKLRRIIWMIVPFCLIWLLYNIFFAYHNLTYLEKNWLYFVFPVSSVVFALIAIWIHRRYIKYSKKKQKLFDAGLVVLSMLFSIGAFMTNKDAGEYIVDYSFLRNDSVYNQKVATYMERFVVSHSEADETARIRLAEYYMAIGDGANALRITEPMNNVKRYKEGCAYAADALYRFQESRSVVWRIIEQYKEVYHDIPPVALQYLEGIMLFKGEGNESKIKEGFDILMRLAESGNAKAQYDVGYYLCNIRVNKHNQFALVHVSEGGDLVAAAEYLRMAAAILPEAAVELGTLYADLTVEDSAMKYLNRVTDGFYTNASDSLISEAFYQKALFYLTTPGNDSIGRDILKEATNRKYPKALLYEAYLNDDPKRAIDIYEKEVGNHKVENYRCYIDPVVFDYLAVGDDKKALDKLIASQPAGGFNNDFVLGMKFFMQAERDRKAGLDQQVVADSTMAMEYMRRSANGNNGCLYAKMICCYYDAKASLQQGKSPQTEIYELHRIASEIPFAYVLEGYLRTLGDNGKDYELIENAAIRAMCEKHPVGAYLFTFMPEGYVTKISKLINGSIDDDQELGGKSIMMQAALRQTNRALKPYLLYTVYCLDRQCDVKINRINAVDKKYEYHNITKLHFWADVAIANHAYYLETQLLPLAHHYNEEKYSRMLVEAALKDFPGAPCDTIGKGPNSTIRFHGIPWVIYSLETLTSFLQVMPKEYVKALKQRYGSDEAKKVFFAPGLVKDVFSPEFNDINLPLMGKLSMLGLDIEDTGLHLLNEFSDIGRYSYQISLEFDTE